MKRFITLAIAMLFVSCGSVSVAHKEKNYSLQSTKWVLVDVKSKAPTLTIQDGKIFGNAGCNDYVASITTDEATLHIGQLGVTKMFCKAMSVENTFLKFLAMANRYKIKGNTLELYKDSMLLMKFTAE